MRKSLVFLAILFFAQVVKAEVEPSLNASTSVTPDATTQGDTEIFYDIGAALGIPLNSAWFLTPSYSLGINTISGTVEYFSSVSAALGYDCAPQWNMKPAFFETLSHNTDYHSEKAKISLTYSIPEPSTLTFYFGPSYFHDSDHNQKWGGFAGLSGDFNQSFFWYADAGMSFKTSGNQNSMDQTATLGAGYDMNNHFTFSCDITLFRGISGTAVHQNNKQISTLAKPSKTINQNNRDETATEITLTAGLNYNF